MRMSILECRQLQSFWMRYGTLPAEYPMPDSVPMPDEPGTPTSGITLITRERWRQVSHHHFDAERDDKYTDDELVSAALHYAYPDAWDPHDLLNFWPMSWDRRYDQRDNDTMIERLAKAGALIAAEIDRRIRLAEDF